MKQESKKTPNLNHRGRSFFFTQRRVMMTKDRFSICNPCRSNMVKNGVLALLEQHPEIKFVSLVGIDLDRQRYGRKRFLLVYSSMNTINSSMQRLYQTRRFFRRPAGHCYLVQCPCWHQSRPERQLVHRLQWRQYRSRNGQTCRHAPYSELPPPCYGLYRFSFHPSQYLRLRRWPDFGSC